MEKHFGLAIMITRKAAIHENTLKSIRLILIGKEEFKQQIIAVKLSAVANGIELEG